MEMKLYFNFLVKCLNPLNPNFYFSCSRTQPIFFILFPVVVVVVFELEDGCIGLEPLGSLLCPLSFTIQHLAVWGSSLTRKQQKLTSTGSFVGIVRLR